MTWQYGPNPKLSEWEIRELQHRASTILEQNPAGRGWWPRDGRYVKLRQLAADYDINLRTLYRYMRRAA
jgi:hypothetical protein